MHSAGNPSSVPDSSLPVFCHLGVLLAGSVFISSTLGADSPGGKFGITSKGQPKAEIVVEDEPLDQPMSFAAQELQRYVKEMSGAVLPVVRVASRKPAILLALRPLPQDRRALDQAREKDHPRPGARGSDLAAPWDDPREEDHYRLDVDAKRLRIEGASPRAVLFGVYDVLERLGCGWCVPGDDTVPKHETLALAALRVDSKPAFQYRMMLDFPMQSVPQTIAICDWIAKNRMNWVHECPNAHGEPKAWYERRDRVVPELKRRGLRLIVGGHTMHTWLPETHFNAHPEWFAYDGGERKPPTLCISNPEMTAELISNMKRFLDRCPEVDVVDLWHTDGEVFCHCPLCTRGLLPESTKGRKPESMPADAVQSAYVITYIEFVNRIAAAIARDHPGVMLGPLIYSQTDRAMPDGCPAPADNVLLGLAHISRDSYRPLAGEPKSAINQRFLGNDLTWMAKSRHSYIYEYYNGWIAPYIYPGAQVIVRDLQLFQELEMPGVSSDMYGYSPVNMYVAARALWSPGISWQAAVRDFHVRYYGDVGEEISANEIRLETGIYGLNGYQASGARDPEKWADPPAAGLYLRQQRPEQIAFLERLITRTKDAKVRQRLERALKPWALWNKEPRFWAFPDFKEASISTDAPIALDSRHQLFLDDYLIASMTGVKRTVEQARKYAGNPVLWPAENWEPSKATVYGSVLREGAKFKMWYQSGAGVGYAESEDGIRWLKPRFDLTLLGGDRSNVLFTKKSPTDGPEALPYFQELFGVHRDERDPDPARRYKMGFLAIDWKYNGPDGVAWHKGQRRGLGVAGSPDGIHWKLVDSWATTAISDGATHWMLDPARGTYVLYGRTLQARPEVVAAWQTNDWFKQWFSGRAVARLESPDFLKWNFTRPETAPVVMTADLQDEPGTEIYSMKVFPYEGIYVGLVQIFHALPENPTLDLQLAVSRDGIHFTRVGDRSPFLPVGPAGSWDRFNLSSANNDPIILGDELRFYYGGRLYRHSPYSGPDKGPERSGIGFASIRRDRFVALEASFDGGEIRTRPVAVRGATLHFNCKSDFGEILVEVRDANDKLLARSESIQRDALDVPVKWTGGFDAPDSPVTLRILLRNARLFALWCGP